MVQPSHRVGGAGRPRRTGRRAGPARPWRSTSVGCRARRRIRWVLGHVGHRRSRSAACLLARSADTEQWPGATSRCRALIGRVQFNDQGLVPAIVQEATSHAVLMLAWMDAEAIRRTLATRASDVLEPQPAGVLGEGRDLGQHPARPRTRLDCDGDTVLLTVDQVGPACHTGATTCFDAATSDQRDFVSRAPAAGSGRRLCADAGARARGVGCGRGRGAPKPWLRADRDGRRDARLVAEVTGTDIVAAGRGARAWHAWPRSARSSPPEGWVRRVVGVLIVAAMVFVVVVGGASPGRRPALVEDGLAAKGWSGGDYDVAERVVALAGCRRGRRLVQCVGDSSSRFATRLGDDGGAVRRADRATQPPTADATEADVWRAIDRGDDPTSDR